MIKIPILNIYYMLCYSWNILDEQNIVEVEQIDKKDVLNLFASVLCNGITYLLKRGLDRSYVIFEEDSRTIRGKIDFSRTLKKQLLKNAKVACIYDELSHNVLHNQILKSTLKLLIRNEDIDEDRTHRYRNS